MKVTGARIVARTPSLAMCFSTSYLLSKCGMPVCRLAEPTEVKTRCTPAASAASAAATPCRVSASVPPPNGVVIAKREVAPSSAFVIAAVSSSDAATSVDPALASAFAWLESGSRVTARTWWPRSRRPRATAPPCLPVDPVTTTVSFCAMFWFLVLRSWRLQCASKHIAERLGRAAAKALDVAGHDVERTHGEARLDADDDVDDTRRQTRLRQSGTKLLFRDDAERERLPSDIGDDARAFGTRQALGPGRVVDRSCMAIADQNSRSRGRHVITCDERSAVLGQPSEHALAHRRLRQLHESFSVEVHT